MIGQVIGNYKILEKLGEGGMGEVFKGLDMMLEREVAIKSLRPELTRQKDIVERFRKEAIILAKLNHPNIATLFSFFVQDERFYMVMEYAQGESLSKVIARHIGGMAWRRAVMLMMQALNALDHAHNLGIIHRDIKPGNIMLSDKEVLKVMDFGIARMVGAAHLTRTGYLVGTPAYMAPEQIRGKNIDARTDIYALGIVLYELLVGRKPFDGESEYDLLKAQVEDTPPPLRTFSTRIPPSVEDAVMRALAKPPEQRFQSAREFRFALEQALLDKPETKRGATLSKEDDPERTLVAFYPEFDTSARLAEEAEKLRREEEEEDRRKAEEEEQRRREEEAARLKAEEAEKRRLAEEDARRKAAEEEQRRREEEAARLKAEEAEKRRLAEEEARRKAAEEEQRRREEEEARLKAEEAEKRRLAEEEARRKGAEEEQRRREEEEARLKAEEAEKRRLAEEEARR